MSTKPVYLLFLSDSHAGHKMGLCNPDAVLWDEDKDGKKTKRGPGIGKFQLSFWKDVMRILKRAKKIVGSSSVIIAHNGDITHGVKFAEGLMSTEIDDQVQIAYHNLVPWVDAFPGLKAVRLVHGTSVHTFSGHAENAVARDLHYHINSKRKKGDKVDVSTFSHVNMNVSGVTFNVAHHGPSPGIRNWTRGNALLLYVKSQLADYLDFGDIPPDYIVRAHYHTWVPHVTTRKLSQGKLYTTTGVLLPALCGLTRHSRKVTKSTSSITVGVVLFKITPQKRGKPHVEVYGPEEGLVLRYSIATEEVIT